MSGNVERPIPDGSQRTVGKDPRNTHIASPLMVLVCAVVPLVGLYGAFINFRGERRRTGFVYLISSVCGIALWIAWIARP
jgi:hypothetical protein